MSNQIQIIERDGKPEWAVLPYDVYLQLTEKVEMLLDIRDYDRVKLAIERGEMEVIPSEVTFALLDDEQPIKVWREYRGLTQQQLAAAAGISVPYLSQIENRRRTGTKEVLLAIARALNLALDDIASQ